MRCQSNAAAMLLLSLLIPWCAAALGIKPAHAGEWWLAGALGADFSLFDPMATISLEAGLWPEHKRWGFQSYFEFADPACDDEMWTLGAEAMWRFRKLYTGIGLAFSDKRLCDRAGTKWNFTIALGMRITEHIDVQWRHRSHGDDLGIRKNTPNDGVNLIQLRVHR